MYAPAVFDLHCDTLTAFRDAPSPSGERDTLDLPGCHFALSKLPSGVRWCQCCAIFLPDQLRGEEASRLLRAPPGQLLPADGAVF